MSTESDTPQQRQPAPPETAVDGSTAVESAARAARPTATADTLEAEAEAPVTIQSFRKEIENIESIDGRNAQAAGEVYAVMMLVFWGIAGVSGWHGWLAGFGVGLLLLLVGVVANTISMMVLRIILGASVGIPLAIFSAQAGFGWYLARTYDPQYIGWGIASMIAIGQTIRYVQLTGLHRAILEARHLSPRLKAELEELPESLRPDILEILDQVARDRAETCAVLTSALSDDGGVDRVALLGVMDDAFACLLNRTRAVNGLQDRVIDDPEDPVTRSAAEALERFRETAAGVHSMAISVFSYAANKSDDASAAMEAQVEELARLADVWSELEGL